MTGAILSTILCATPCKVELVQLWCKCPAIGIKSWGVVNNIRNWRGKGIEVITQYQKYFCHKKKDISTCLHMLKT